MARAVDLRGRMALPFDLPTLSRGFAALSPSARAAGGEAARAASQALSALLGCELRVEARATPGRGAPRAPAARVGLDLAALPATALLEVEPALVVRLVDRLAGGAGEADGAAALTPVEGAALELLALAALDGACSVASVEERLAPRLSRAGCEPAGALCVELDVVAGAVRGRARLLLPAAAVQSLALASDAASSDLRLGASLRRGATSLSPEELDALAPGDVVVLDPGEAHDAVVLPGGGRLLGRLDGETFHVEEIGMTERALEIPIRLEVELARVELTLSDLARLEAGAVVPLGLDRRGLVTLRAGERAVARGELVEVEGAVGVRILSVEVTP